jgi:hypothetical protein
MQTPKWAYFRTMFDKAIDEKIRADMASSKWLSKKGITNP